MSTKTVPGSRRLLLLNLAGLGALMAFHPHLRFAANPAQEWFYWLSVALAGAALIYGAYSLVSPERGRRGWPQSYLMLAWFLAGSMVIVPYVERAKKQSHPAGGADAQKPLSEIDQFLQDAPQAKQSASNEQFIDGPYNPNDRRVTETNWERGAITPPPAAVKPSSNPFSDPDFGKELVRK